VQDSSGALRVFFSTTMTLSLIKMSGKFAKFGVKQ